MRIRTVKPEFFKHEELFQAEKENNLPLRVAFAGLWCASDREGRFKWRPRQLGTDILPYDEVDFSRVLDALTTRGFIVKYRVGNEWYGAIPSFPKHQVINNRERPSELPEVSKSEELIDASSTREARVDHASLTCTRGREGKGREGKEIAAPVPASGEHVAFIDGWVQNFKAKFGFDYSFDGGRDGKAVRELLKMGVLRLDLLEIAKQAWDKSGKTPKFFNCDQSVTIHGFRNHFNQIRTEIKNGTQTHQRVNPRNIGISRPSTGGDYGEAAKRKLERQALEAQRRAASEAQGNGTPSGPVLHGDVGTPTGGQVAGSGGQ